MTSKIFANGINYSTGKPLVAPIDEESFGNKIQQSLFQNAKEIQFVTQTSFIAKSFRREIERTTLDIGNPKVAGWTFLVSESDPQFSEIVEIINPLAKHRNMEDPKSPLIFDKDEENDQPWEQWSDWLKDNYHSSVLEGKKPPHYVLIIGGPDLIPFKFQSLLDSAASVGRVAFDSMQDLQNYVEKIIYLEKLPEPEIHKEAIMFAPDGGIQDATYFSQRYMAKPLTDHLNNTLGFKTTAMLGATATKQNLVNSFLGSHPAVVYTASHGLGAPDQELQTQKSINGAICCQHIPGQPIDDDSLFSAADVEQNIDENFLEGSIFIQFACFGYGTPSQSDFMHWLGQSELNSEEDFIAALPKRLLAHPHGPIVYIGHVDTAWLHGFDDPDNPYIFEKWDPRMAPFVFALNTLLKEVNPVGVAWAEMNKRYDEKNAILTSALDRLKRKKMQMTSDFYSQIADIFITRTDAQNYMIFGDPAVRLRILE